MNKPLFLTIIALALKQSRCDSLPSSDLTNSFSLRTQNELSRLLSANISGYTAEFGLHGALVARQLQCVDPGYLPCPFGDVCCPAGDTCFPVGCCRSGYEPCGNAYCYDPSRSICCSDGSSCPLGYDCVTGGCCPTSEVRCGAKKCYNPSVGICCGTGSDTWGCPKSNKCCGDGFCYKANSEICCVGGSCPEEDSCCQNECCRPIAYCGGDGFCSACPAATRTSTTTWTSTYLAVATRTITEISEPEEAASFSCAPMTATNSEGATLELDTDCSFSYTPPETTADSNNGVEVAGRRASPITPIPQLRPRQLSCTPFETVTKTLMLTRTTTSSSTTTATVFTEPVDFSCVPMTVTNANGDVLSLDEECQMEFELGSTTSDNGPQRTPNAAGLGRERFANAAWGVAVVGFLGL